MKLLCHYPFGVSIIQVSQVHCRTAQQKLCDRHKQMDVMMVSDLTHQYPWQLVLYR